ncbi:hypothetical protein LCGC14_0944880 [marine sediment metagenome]|uniref:Peptide deformylase n=1 Tax=marine sediment metagenome TaxID=412755 RepID=A0A0F9P536_9ZZZZ
MTVRTIIEYPNKILTRVAKPVNVVGDGIRTLIKDMYHTMEAHDGIGFAGPQIGVGKRVIVLNIPEPAPALGDIRLTLINPEIIEQSDEIVVVEEGCLSLPSIWTEGPLRNKTIKFRALDGAGVEFEMYAEGLFSVCVQHEIDHLNGKVFVDHLSRLKKDRIIKKLNKARKR